MLAGLPVIGRAGAPDGIPILTHVGGGAGASLVEGGTLLVEIAFPAAASAVEGALPITITPQYTGGRPLVEPQPLFFFPAADGRTVRTILSAPLDSGGHAATLRLAARVLGRTREWRYAYEARAGSYGRSVLTLSRASSAPPPDVAERKRREFETNVAVYRGRTPRAWSDAFLPPVPHASKNNFGLRRTVNGTLHYRHAGLDYPVPIGTPVRAVNDGRVALSTEQWTPGQVVVVDHGGGIFSRYMHLSERLVAAGERVSRGQVIGRSGNTGGQRTAPHLHFETIVNGTPVDPSALMRTAARLVSLERGGM